MKKAEVAAIIILSLIVWMLFWFQSMPLDPASTLGVVFICIVFVLAFKWLRNRFEKEPKA